MAHYAFLDENDIVIDVINGIDETETIEGLPPEIWYADFVGKPCKRTSYHGNIRYNYAGIGYTYDPIRDAFIEPEPPGAIGFYEETCQWIVPPTDYPSEA
jgi:hypothetical protein